ncbi:MAG: hypothetical protein QOG62_2030 [Thermoleophilaceae bacterium]|jgi:DNA-binding NarL/FixJ family response regulator|nr:hypothetical protein [Thermoleophilaceae bacterium]
MSIQAAAVQQPDNAAHGHLSAVPAAAPAVLVFSDRELVAAGLARMARYEAGATTRTVSRARMLATMLPGAAAAIIDLGAEGAGEAAALVSDSEASLLLVTATAGAAVPKGLLWAADAVLVADQLDQRTLGFALNATSQGMRIVPRDLGEPLPATSEDRRPGERAIHVLSALAEGKRDGEIALDLGITEAAARKVAQRAVQAIGARTRCQAVAMAVGAGWVA